MDTSIFNLSPFAILGILSAVLSTFAYLPYMRDTLRGRTYPQRASWFIWSVLSSIGFFSQAFEGATHSLWFAGAQISGTITVFLMSIRFGVGGFVNRRDCLVLLLAAGGLVAWNMTDSAVYALAMTIGIGTIGGLVTVTKAYWYPNSETLSTWFLSFIASILAILAVGRLDWVILAFPLYLLILNGAIVSAIILGKNRQVTTTVAP